MKKNCEIVCGVNFCNWTTDHYTEQFTLFMLLRKKFNNKTYAYHLGIIFSNYFHFQSAPGTKIKVQQLQCTGFCLLKRQTSTLNVHHVHVTSVHVHYSKYLKTQPLDSKPNNKVFMLS